MPLIPARFGLVTGHVFWSLAVVLLLSLALLTGCQPEDMVKVDVSREVQMRTGAPAKVTLAQYQDVKAQYEDSVKAESEKKAAEAATAARALTRATRTVQTKYADQIASLQRQAEAEVESLAGDAEEKQAAIETALAGLHNEFTRVRERMKMQEAAAQARADQLASLLNMGLNQIAPEVAKAVPGVGWLLPVLTGVGGLLMRRPGDATREQAAKTAEAEAIKAAEDRGYDMGRNEALAAARDGMLNKVVADAAGKVVG